MKRDRQQQEILGEAVRNAFLKLDPRIQWKNPVMFIVFLGAILVAVLAVRAFMAGNTQEGWFDLHIDLWLWFTVLFANFAEAVAEGRGKAQAESLRKARKSLQAKKIKADGSFEIVGSEAIRKGDIVLVEAGDTIPNDGEVIEGMASVDESAVTGESAPVIRESGGDKSSVTGGTKVLSDWIKVRVTTNPGETLGNRMATEFIPAAGITAGELADAAQLASLADETPEGRSIVVLAKEKYGLRERDLTHLQAEFIPFTAQTRMSGIDIVDARIRKGSMEAMQNYVSELGGAFPAEVRSACENIAHQGGTPLVVAKDKQVLGVIYLKDIVKGGIKERFSELRKMGIKTIMITGDNQLTAAAIAAEAGVDDFLAEATPEAKLKMIRSYQQQGMLVAMTGDGTNDAPALAQADVGVAMNSGTQAAKEAGNMVDLDSNPTKLIEVVEIGKQLLMTRGSLTTFSIANDIAKYFAIIPALFAATYAPLEVLNIMQLHSPQSAILSAVIFNALIIIALIPLAMKGVAYKPLGASKILQRNLLIYGVGGIIVPFIGIKIIDVLLVALGLA